MLTTDTYIGAYRVVSAIGESAYAETYKVKDERGKLYFLKLIDFSRLGREQYDDDGRVLEMEISRQLRHPNIARYRDSGAIETDDRRCVYIVYDLIVGESVADRLAQMQCLTVNDAKQIVVGVLNGLKYMHSLPRPIVHNRITPHSVLLDLSRSVPIVKLTGFGSARHTGKKVSVRLTDDPENFYIAPETLRGESTVQSDIFSVGALLYHLVFGMVPYYMDLSSIKNDPMAILVNLANASTRPLRIPNIPNPEINEQLINTIAKALAPDASNRFRSAEEFIKALNGEIIVGRTAQVRNDMTFGGDTQQNKDRRLTKKTGNGFRDVAGMKELKEQLQSDVIDVIQDPEQAKALGISIPNGLLFFGPPGCGKTFFAEKFAEEAGYNYRYISCSDIASPYIHGGQDKIAAIFNEARENAPTILFFDEIDAMMTDRSKHNNVSESGEVNEFLAQLNNCGADGVLVIGATNKPEQIDDAALRAGRLEMKYYIPVPDEETREAIFEIELSKRKSDTDIDCERLAQLTENYISADIKLIIDNAARLTFRRKLGTITQATLEEAIAASSPSLSPDVIKRHEETRDRFLGGKHHTTRRRIGF